MSLDLSPDMARSTPTAPRGTSRLRIRVWSTVAVGVLVAGTVGSFVLANSIAVKNVDQSRRDLASSSAEVASTLQLAIQHEEDLVVSAGGFIAGNPTASTAQFVAWANSVRALERYPELLGFGQAIIVSAAQLPAFEARAMADPAGPLAADGTFQVIPPGPRPFYCFPTTGQARTTAGALPAGFDYCAGGPASAGLLARDTGQGAYIPLPLGAQAVLVVLTPIYSNGIVPTTVAARRTAFVGWMGMEVVPNVLLERALANHAGLAVTFTYHSGSSNAAFSSGTIAKGAHSVTTNLNNGWTVKTFGTLAVGGIFANSVATWVLIGGISLSLLLATLMFVLATGRNRALSLVSVKTDELRHQALHDALTGLPNRTLIMDRIEQLQSRSRRAGTLGAALYVDLDGFKNVNDSLGHLVGDRLLIAVAARLTATLRDADTIGRLGGDEFVVLIEGADMLSAPELVAERLLEVVRQPFDIDEVAAPIMITASVGIAIGDHESPEELLREADMALYQAKGAGRNCYETFQPQMGADTLHRYELEFDLRQALDSDQFRLVYQPIYALDDLELVGVEALLRWEHPTLGQIQPDEFIPLLEASGQIIDVGRWVLIEACTRMAAWRAEGSDLVISVNVSARQLDRDVIVDDVRHALADSGLDAAALTIEITETALMRNIDLTARRLRDLKALGVEIAIDDFGTGYSSLAYLQRFPVDCLKIDRAFTDAITRSPESDALIHTLVQLGKDLGLRTLAEGVETAGQIDYLRTENVTEVQGFLFAKPLDQRSLETQILAPARHLGPAPVQTEKH
jgi:diguanylate cyclase (GGDEF)-like protein